MKNRATVYISPDSKRILRIFPYVEVCAVRGLLCVTIKMRRIISSVPVNVITMDTPKNATRNMKLFRLDEIVGILERKHKTEYKISE